MSQSIYEKYGGFKTVSRIVITFYELALDSDRVGDFFANVDMPRLIDHQTKFISSILGGPASFSDDRLRAVHRGLEIDHGDFDEIIGLLHEALEVHGMADEDIRRVLSDVDAKRPVIVSAGAG